MKVVDVEDIYDEFSYGVLSPQGIKDFLTYTYQNWVSPVPQYVLLVGDSTYDPKDNFGTGMDQLCAHVPGCDAVYGGEPDG